jgi:hypothetical protein
VNQSCDCQHQGGWAPGSGGQVNSGEAVLNVVNVDKPKMLIGLDQKVRGQVQGLIRPLAQMTHHRRRAATFPTLGTSAKRGKPVVLPASYTTEVGKAARKSRRQGSG